MIRTFPEVALGREIGSVNWNLAPFPTPLELATTLPPWASTIL